MEAIYLAHPLGGTSPEDTETNFRAYVDLCATILQKTDVTILSWAHHHLAHSQLDFNSEDYLRRDFALIERADAVWFGCPPWKAVSIGLWAEWLWARALGKPTLRAWWTPNGSAAAGGQATSIFSVEPLADPSFRDVPEVFREHCPHTFHLIYEETTLRGNAPRPSLREPILRLAGAAYTAKKVRA